MIPALLRNPALLAGLAGCLLAADDYVIKAGTRIPLVMVNSVSTKNSAAGDRLYLETAFPILTKGRIVIPAGSYVAGTVTFLKRPGRVKGRGELFLRFDSLTLPNGVTRDFRARLGAGDPLATGQVDGQEGKLRGDTDRGQDARTAAETTTEGASVGALAGAAGGHPGVGAGIGAAGGAAAGLAGVLLTRGPGVVLPKGSTVEMVLDRDLHYSAKELGRTK